MAFYWSVFILDGYGLFFAALYLWILIKRRYLFSWDSAATLLVLCLMSGQLSRLLVIVAAGTHPEEVRNLKLVGIENFFLGWYWIGLLKDAVQRVLSKLR